MSFEALHIKPEIVKALKEDEIITPTSIQEKAIPLIIEGKDLIGISKTGSGKTAAFGVPLLQRMDPGKGLQTLVLAPTRELAVQIAKELQKFGKHLHFRVATVFGGVALDPQVRQIARAHIVVGTPGRLLDHLQRRTLNLSHISHCVLDEADKMVEMGFIEDIRRIIDVMPQKRQLLLFGATISHEIEDLKRRYMHDPAAVRAESHVKEEFLQQYYYNVKSNEKFSLLVHLLKTEEMKRVMIFCSTKTTVNLLTRNLRTQGISCEMIHGNLTQNKRLHVMEQFNKGKPTVLVASAVAARGLDIRDVSHIFNYDLSRDPQEYIHRIGRTARAGESGKAITLLAERDYDAMSNIQRRYDVKIKELEKGQFPQIRFNARQSERDDGGRGFGRYGGRRGGGGNGFGGHRGRSEGGGRWNTGGRSGGRSGFGGQRRRSEGGGRWNTGGRSSGRSGFGANRGRSEGGSGGSGFGGHRGRSEGGGRWNTGGRGGESRANEGHGDSPHHKRRPHDSPRDGRPKKRYSKRQNFNRSDSKKFW